MKCVWYLITNNTAKKQLKHLGLFRLISGAVVNALSLRRAAYFAMMLRGAHGWVFDCLLAILVIKWLSNPSCTVCQSLQLTANFFTFFSWGILQLVSFERLQSLQTAVWRWPLLLEKRILCLPCKLEYPTLLRWVGGRDGHLSRYYIGDSYLR